MSNELELLDDDFVKIVKDIEKDILNTRYNIISKANKEVVNFYLRLGKIISDNAKYGNNFINRLSVALKLDFPDEQGFSARNLARMRKVYEAYKDLASIPEELEIISWSQNCVLVDKIEDIDKRVWYAKQIIENGWSKTVLSHQIDLELYERQALPEKMTNFNDKLPIAQSEFARDMIKDPYIFELANIGKRAKERDIENADRLCDKLLESEVTSGIYPINEYFITVPKGKKWIQEDYERDYGLSSLILIFFTFAMIGWLWEVLLFLFTMGKFF